MKLFTKTLLSFLLSLLLLSSFSYAASKPIGGIVAKVNDEIITTEQLHQQVLIFKEQPQAPSAKVLRKKVLDMMINQALQLQVASRVGLTLTNEEKNEMLENMAKSQKTTTQQLLIMARQQGLSKKEFLSRWERSLLISKLQKEIILPQVHISQKEIDTYVNKMKKQNNEFLYHIEDLLIALPTSPKPEQIKKAQQLANDLIKKLKAGKELKSLEGTEITGQSALQFNDLDWQSLAELPPVFARAIQTMNTDDISQPLRAHDGLHILSLVGVRTHKNNPDPEALRNEVANMLFKRKFEARLAIWLQQLRASSYIKIMLE